MDDDTDPLHDWYVSELRRLTFTKQERDYLVVLLEAGELDLASFRDLIEKRGWSTRQALLAVA